MSNSLKPFFTVSLLIRAFAASCVLLLSVAATPRLGIEDVPELPMPDGSGDTPEMIVDLLTGAAAPAAEGQKQLKLSSLRGKVTLIDMFRSTCPHCQDHAPHIVELYNQYRDRGFTVLGLATDNKENKDDVETVKAYVSLAKIEYQVGFITPEIIAYYVDTHDTGVPQMILFGPDGKMAIRRIGWNEKIGKEIRAAIEAQLAKMPTVKPGSKASSRPASRKTKQG
ncbi:MAG TPA: TlpA disulfide reductase family protein [Blastocatellia bacterium]|jgi:thiol-disulfide isomerase/thioredoxin|nr:TlpA disulfide reductase family protein [Blastocatellia bacterium]